MHPQEAPHTAKVNEASMGSQIECLDLTSLSVSGGVVISANRTCIFLQYSTVLNQYNNATALGTPLGYLHTIGEFFRCAEHEDGTAAGADKRTYGLNAGELALTLPSSLAGIQCNCRFRLPVRSQL